MRRLLFFICIAFAHSAFAGGDEVTDSLKKVLAATKDTSRIRIIYKLSMRLATTDKKQVDSWMTEAQQLAEKSGDARLIQYTHVMRYKVFDERREYSDALNEILVVEKMAVAQGDSLRVGICNTDYGRILNEYKADHAGALAHYYRALRIYRELGNHEKEMRVNVNLANLMAQQGDYDAALKMYLSADSLALANGLKDVMGEIPNNIGSVYYQKKDFKTAERYFRIALERKQKSGNQRGVAGQYSNIGVLKLEMNQYDSAKYYLHLAYAMCSQLRERYGIAMSQINLGSVFLNAYNQLDSSEYYLVRGVAVADSIQANELRIDSYRVLAKLYAAKKDSGRAYLWNLRFQALNDSVNGASAARKQSLLEARFASEKKELENKQHLADKAWQRIVIWILSGGGLLLLIAMAQLFRRFSEKKKANSELESRNTTILGQKQIIEEKNKEITDSISYAQKLQEAVLPDITGFRKLLPQSFVFFLPRDLVSGDFFWWTQFEKKQQRYLVFAVADCTGHGVPGALVSMVGNNLLHQLFNEEKITSPAEALGELNRRITRLLRSEDERQRNDGMDIALCIYEPSSQSLVYAGANRPLFLIGKPESREVLPLRRSIGGGTPPDTVFEEHRIPLSAGDMVYLYSDGYADQFGGEGGKKFLSRNFRELLREISSQETTEQEQTLKARFHEWKGHFEQLDDVLVAGVRFGSESGPE